MIRPAEAKDVPALGKLLLQVHAVHAQGRPDLFAPGMRKYTDEDLLLLLQDASCPVFVWEGEDGIVSGYVFCELKETRNGGGRFGRRVLYIDDLCVDEACRGTGIGKRLYAFAREEAKRKGCDAVTLNVWALNPTAKAFYDNLGLKELKTTMEDIL